MIDERELTQLLEEAAATFDVPADGGANVLAAATQAPDRLPRAPRWRSRRPRLVVGVSCALVALVGIFALGTLVGSRKPTPKFANVGGSAGNGVSNGGMSAGADEGAVGGTAGGAGLLPATPTPLRGAAKSAGSQGAAGAAQPAAPAPGPILEAGPGPVRAPADSAKIVKTGSVQIEVRKGAVGPTMTRLTTMAAGFGGYAAETKTAEGADNPTASATFRIPVDNFENMLTNVRSLGTVRSLNTKGQDVTAQYADIQAKINGLIAAREQFLTILHKATAIGDVLAVQDHIIQTQTEIDQLQGNLNVLADQATLAALSVDVTQTGAAVPGPPAPKVGLAKALDDARHGFTHGVESIIGHSGTALLLLLIAAAAVVAVRFSWPRLRRRFV